MAERFELPVEYNGKKHFFKATLNVYVYTHKFHVDVDGQTIIFQPDEEGNYRAIIDYNDLNDISNIDVKLIEKITKVIEGLVR